ncbi:MAG: hypothetical protein U0234_09245 [Sandaracinus sp.]
MRIRIERCHYISDAPLPGLVSGAARQMLFIRSTCSGSSARLLAQPTVVLAAQSPDGTRTARMHAEVRTRWSLTDAAAPVIQLEVTDVPDLTSDVQWHVETEGGATIGDLNLRVLARPSVHDAGASLSIRYGLPDLQVLGAGGAHDHMAVVDPTRFGTWIQVADRRVDEFQIPPAVTARSDQGADPARLAEIGLPLFGAENVALMSMPATSGLGLDDGMVWCVSSDDPAVEVITSDGVPLPTHRWTTVSGGRVRFRARTPIRGAIQLLARASYWGDLHMSGCEGDGGDLVCLERRYREARTGVRRTEYRGDELAHHLRDARTDCAQPSPGPVCSQLNNLLFDTWAEGLESLHLPPPYPDYQDQIAEQERAFDVVARTYLECISDPEERRGTRAGQRQRCDDWLNRAVAFDETRAQLDRVRLREYQLWRAALAMDACGGAPASEFPIVVADGARSESVPLPMRLSLSVRCQFETHEAQSFARYIGRDGDVIAPYSSDDCVLAYEPPIADAPWTERSQTSTEPQVSIDDQRLAQAVSSFISTERLRLYGRQLVTVRVRAHDQSQDVTRQLVFQPWPRDTPEIMSLSFPTGGQQEDDFIVSVEENVQDVDHTDPPYRQDWVRPPSTDSALTRSEFAFQTRIRPRGPLGSFVVVDAGGRTLGLRAYITIPVGVATMRLPGATADLASTGSETAVQLTTLRTGLLAAIEPWDFESRSSPLPVALSLQTGLLLQSFTSDAFQAPSYVLGLGMGLPIVQQAGASQTGVTANMSFLWEHDFRYGGENHFMLLISANLLSLLSPQQGGGSGTNAEH